LRAQRSAQGRLSTDRFFLFFQATPLLLQPRLFGCDLRGGCLTQAFQGSLLRFADGRQPRQFALQGGQPLTPLRFLRQFGVDLLQTPVKGGQVTLQRFTTVGSAFAVRLPDFQPQNTAQNFLTPGRWLLGKLIGFALQEKGDIDKSLVIEVQNLFNARLCFAHSPFGERAPHRFLLAPGALLNLELQHRRLATGQGADDAIDVALIGKGKSHFRRLRLQVDDRLIPLARLPKERPGHRIQQRGFACTIGARNTGEMESGEIHFCRLAIRKETREFEVNGYHASIVNRKLQIVNCKFFLPIPSTDVIIAACLLASPNRLVRA
jgi:hypothetical protein